MLSRCCGDALHLKTSGLTYLEALRVILQVDYPFFSALAEFARAQFGADSAGAGVSTTFAEVQALPRPGTLEAADAERVYLEERAGRQMFHVTYGSVLSRGRGENGRPFGESLIELLDRYADLYHAALTRRLERHFELLAAP